MNAESDSGDLICRANEKLQLGRDLVVRLEVYRNIPGVQKVQRKIEQEIKFLEKVIKNGKLILNHVQCSNLSHYELIVQLMERQSNVLHVDCSFIVPGRGSPLRVDIVCENGLKWIKAVARNTKSLIDIVKGETSYGAKSILDQAQEFVDAAKINLCMFRQPSVVFYFSHHLDDDLLRDLQSIGVETADIAQEQSSSNERDDGINSNISILNLDITTLLAYISAVTNGSSHWVFQEPILTEQAEKERQTALKPILDDLFKDKHLICCETAHKSFQDIVNLLGGPQECARASKLMSRVEILPDIDDIPEQLSVIKLSGKINQRSLKIFAFGMQMRAVTVTSNKAFVRSAKMQGINVPVFTHAARALTEMKECTATSMQG